MQILNTARKLDWSGWGLGIMGSFVSGGAGAIATGGGGISQRDPEMTEVKVQLTDRELEFIKLLCGEELTHKEVAERLHISIRTVKFHAGSLYRKLCPAPFYGHGQAMVRLTKFAIRNKLIEL